jgi:hypothetical protein
MQQMVEFFMSIELVKIFDRISRVYSNNVVAYKALLRGGYCEVFSQVALTTGQNIPITDLKEMTGATHSGTFYPMFEYVPKAGAAPAASSSQAAVTTAAPAPAPVKRGYEPDNFMGRNTMDAGRSLIF